LRTTGLKTDTESQQPEAGFLACERSSNNIEALGKDFMHFFGWVQAGKNHNDGRQEPQRRKYEHGDPLGHQENMSAVPASATVRSD
jgi:hypothetical protein